MFIRNVSVVLALMAVMAVLACGGETAWVVSESTDNLTDVRTVQITTEATDHNRGESAFVEIRILCRGNSTRTF